MDLRYGQGFLKAEYPDIFKEEPLEPKTYSIQNLDENLPTRDYAAGKSRGSAAGKDELKKLLKKLKAYWEIKTKDGHVVTLFEPLNPLSSKKDGMFAVIRNSEGDGKLIRLYDYFVPIDTQLSPDEKFIIFYNTAFRGHPFKVYELANPKKPVIDKLLDPVNGTFAFSPNGQYLLMCGDPLGKLFFGRDCVIAKNIRVYDLWSNSPGKPIVERKAYFVDAKFTPDNNLSITEAVWKGHVDNDPTKRDIYENVETVTNLAGRSNISGQAEEPIINTAFIYMYSKPWQSGPKLRKFEKAVKAIDDIEFLKSIKDRISKILSQGPDKIPALVGVAKKDIFLKAPQRYDTVFNVIDERIKELTGRKAQETPDLGMGDEGYGFDKDGNMVQPGSEGKSRDSAATTASPQGFDYEPAVKALWQAWLHYVEDPAEGPVYVSKTYDSSELAQRAQDFDKVCQSIIGDTGLLSSEPFQELMRRHFRLRDYLNEKWGIHAGRSPESRGMGDEGYGFDKDGNLDVEGKSRGSAAGKARKAWQQFFKKVFKSKKKGLIALPAAIKAVKPKEFVVGEISALQAALRKAGFTHVFVVIRHRKMNQKVSSVLYDKTPVTFTTSTRFSDVGKEEWYTETYAEMYFPRYLKVPVQIFARNGKGEMLVLEHAMRNMDDFKAADDDKTWKWEIRGLPKNIEAVESSLYDEEEDETPGSGMGDEGYGFDKDGNMVQPGNEGKPRDAATNDISEMKKMLAVSLKDSDRKSEITARGVLLLAGYDREAQIKELERIYQEEIDEALKVSTSSNISMRVNIAIALLKANYARSIQIERLRLLLDSIKNELSDISSRTKGLTFNPEEEDEEIALQSSWKMQFINMESRTYLSLTVDACLALLLYGEDTDREEQVRKLNELLGMNISKAESDAIRSALTGYSKKVAGDFKDSTAEKVKDALKPAVEYIYKALTDMKLYPAFSDDVKTGATIVEILNAKDGSKLSFIFTIDSKDPNKIILERTISNLPKDKPQILKTYTVDGAAGTTEAAETMLKGSGTVLKSWPAAPGAIAVSKGEEVSGTSSDQPRNADGTFGQKPGKSPEDAKLVIKLSGWLESRKSIFTLEEYLETYKRVRKEHPELKFDPLAEHPETTARNDLNGLINQSILKPHEDEETGRTIGYEITDKEKIKLAKAEPRDSAAEAEEPEILQGAFSHITDIGEVLVVHYAVMDQKPFAPLAHDTVPSLLKDHMSQCKGDLDKLWNKGKGRRIGESRSYVITSIRMDGEKGIAFSVGTSAEGDIVPAEAVCVVGTIMPVEKQVSEDASLRNKKSVADVLGELTKHSLKALSLLQVQWLNAPLSNGQRPAHLVDEIMIRAALAEAGIDRGMHAEWLENLVSARPMPEKYSWTSYMPDLEYAMALAALVQIGQHSAENIEKMEDALKDLHFEKGKIAEIVIRSALLNDAIARGVEEKRDEQMAWFYDFLSRHPASRMEEILVQDVLLNNGDHRQERIEQLSYILNTDQFRLSTLERIAAHNALLKAGHDRNGQVKKLLAIISERTLSTSLLEEIAAHAALLAYASEEMAKDAGKSAARQDEAPDSTKAARDIASMASFEAVFGDKDAENNAAFKFIYDKIAYGVERICSEFDERYGNDSIKTAEVGIVRGGKSGDTLAVSVNPVTKERRIGIYETFIRGVYDNLYQLVDSNRWTEYEVRAQVSVIEALIDGSILHEAGHGFEGYSGIDLHSLLNDTDAVEAYAALIETSIPKTAQDKERFAETIAELNIGGKQNIAYVTNKAAYLFYKFISFQPGMYIGVDGKIDEKKIRDMVNNYYYVNPHLERAIRAGVSPDGQLIINQVADKVIESCRLFFGERTTWHKKNIAGTDALNGAGYEGLRSLIVEATSKQQAAREEARSAISKIPGAADAIQAYIERESPKGTTLRLLQAAQKQARSAEEWRKGGSASQQGTAEVNPRDSETEKARQVMEAPTAVHVENDLNKLVIKLLEFDAALELGNIDKKKLAEAEKDFRKKAGEIIKGIDDLTILDELVIAFSVRFVDMENTGEKRRADLYADIADRLEARIEELKPASGKVSGGTDLQRGGSASQQGTAEVSPVLTETSPYYVGMSMGGTKLYAALYKRTSGKPEVLGKCSVTWKDAFNLANPRDVSDANIVSPDAIVAKIAETIRGLVAENNLTINDLNNIGCTSPGPLDHDTGVIGTECKTFNMPFDKYPFSRKLSEELGTPYVEVKHDSHSGIEGETALGALVGVDNAYYVIQGTGLGGSPSVKGKYYIEVPELTEPGHHIVGTPNVSAAARAVTSYIYRFIPNYGKGHPYEVVDNPIAGKKHQITKEKAEELITSGKYVRDDFIWTIDGEKDFEDIVAGVGLEPMLKDKERLTQMFGGNAGDYSKINEPRDLSELAINGSKAEQQTAKDIIRYIAREVGKGLAALINYSYGKEWQLDGVVLGSTIGEKLGIDSNGVMLRTAEGEDYYYDDIQEAAFYELAVRFGVEQSFARRVSSRIVRSPLTQDERETAGFDRKYAATAEEAVQIEDAKAADPYEAAIAVMRKIAENFANSLSFSPKALSLALGLDPEKIRPAIALLTGHGYLETLSLGGNLRISLTDKAKKAVKAGVFTREALFEIPDMVNVADSAGKEISRIYPEKYRLLVDCNIYKGGREELDNDRSKGYISADGKCIVAGDRFELEMVDTSNIENILKYVKDPARTIVQVSGNLKVDDIMQLMKKAPGIRVVNVDTSNFKYDNELDAVARQKCRFDLYAMMLAARSITGEDVKTKNSIYRALKFFLNSHYKNGVEDIASHYIDALVVEETVDEKLKKDNITYILKCILSYKPAKPYRVPEYNNVAAALISA
ncbi:MAG: ROK family protein [Candidatus Omnitrophica bacterium]|nr:ROK family protein [Candidatus Omnitrophota bacterium]